MNIFGAFTFGSLIKTFLPGFVWLIAIVIFEAEVSSFIGHPPNLWNFAQSKDQAALVLAIPTSLLLGLVSNIFVFMGINDWLVRRPVRQKEKELIFLFDDLARRIREKCWSVLGCDDAQMRATFHDQIDAEIVALNTIGVQNLGYVREQYWFHLEFQLNLLLSIVAIAVALLILVVTPGMSPTRWGLFSFTLLVSWAIVHGLIVVARRNYSRHLAKMASIMAAVLCEPQPKADKA